MRATEPDEAGERGDAGNVEHRRGTEEDVVADERAGDDLVERVGHEVAMRQHHALRQTRGAAGVEDRGDVVGCNLRGDAIVAGRQQRLVVVDRW